MVVMLTSRNQGNNEGCLRMLNSCETACCCFALARLHNQQLGYNDMLVWLCQEEWEDETNKVR